MYNVVSTLDPSFLIRSSSFLQVTRTAIKFRMSLKFGKIGPQSAELSAFNSLKIDVSVFSRLCIDQIIYKLAGNKDMHIILDVCEFRPDWKTDTI